MEPLSGDWPSYNPQNFSQLRPFDPSAQQPKLMAATYLPTHNRASPPPSQVISTEPKNILLRQLYQKAEEKLRPKRAASDHLTPEHAPKQLRGSS